eukprot:TRINITY_DN19181_c0_g1_i1.p1 TRINITY_DN19181_c0_g1~~TRINITY_DN19181_c0_g1_i1.p1  ORF type:complete len:220 (+),score=23.17 TRINITY_DN19181_c0_g1_i1:58-717(+)
MFPCKIICRSEPATVEELRKMLIPNIIIVSVATTVASIVNLAGDASAIEKGAVGVSLFLLWVCSLIGLFGSWRRNAGIISLYIVIMLVVISTKIVLTLVAGAVVAVSCQMEQMSFSGCYRAAAYLDCIQFSNCTRSVIDNYNSFPTTTVACDTWTSDECTNAESTLSPIAYSRSGIFFLFMETVGTLIPVLISYVYINRLEAERSETASQYDLEARDSR